MRNICHSKNDWGTIKWRGATMPHPVQQDSNSCGVIVTMMAKAVLEAFPALPLMSFGTSKKEMANARTKFALGILNGSVFDIDNHCTMCSASKPPGSGPPTIDWVFAEFHRLTNVNHHNQFSCELDRHTPRLIALYKQKASMTGKTADLLREILRIYDLQEQHDVNMRRTLALRALPLYLRDDASEFFKTCNQGDEPDTLDTPVALLTMVTANTSAIHFNPESTSVVIEDDIVVKDLPQLADGFVVLFGLIYAFNLEYPKNVIHTLPFIQKIMIDDNKPLKPCLLNLKNEFFKE